MRQLLLAILLMQFSKELSAYPNGAPESACMNLTPNHDASFMSTVSPYSIIASSNSTHFRVTIGNGNSNFQGFLIQAFSNANTAVGKFVSIEANTKYLCSSSGVTHSRRLTTSRLVFIWSPNGYNGAFFFKATILRSYSTFWSHQTPQLQTSGQPTQAPTARTQPPTVGPPSPRPPTVRPPSPQPPTVRPPSSPQPPLNYNCYQTQLRIGITLANSESDDERPPPPECMDASFLYQKYMNNELYCSFFPLVPATQPPRSNGKRADDFIEPESEFIDMVFDTRVTKLMKVHGILMVIAWLLCSSSAVLLHRYCRSTWSNVRLCNMPLWKLGYRFLTTSCFLCTVISFIIFFSQFSRGPYYLSKDYLTNVYAVMYIILLILLIIHNIVGMVKVSEMSGRWWLYETVHSSTGELTLCLAVAAIFLTFFTTMYSVNTEDWPFWVEVGTICLHLVVDFFLRAHEKYLNSPIQLKLAEEEALEMKKFGTQKTDKKSIVKTFLVVFHFFISFQLAVAICYGIASAPPFKI